MTPWDKRTFARTLALTVVAFVAALLLGAATDEGNVRWMERVARTLPALPIAGAAGAWLAMAPLRTRGEVRALAAIGRNPWEIVRPAIAACAFAHLVAAILALSSAVAVGTFFPRAAARPALVFRDGDFVDEGRGVRILADGTMEGAPITAAPKKEDVPPFGRLAVAGMLLFAGIAIPMWALRRERLRKVVLAYGATAGATIVCFHGAAVGAFPALAAVVPSGALLAGAALRYRREIR